MKIADDNKIVFYVVQLIGWMGGWVVPCASSTRLAVPNLPTLPLESVSDASTTNL